MTRKKILSESQSYTFPSYFEMPYEPDEILAELGYSLIRKHLTLPQIDRYLERLEELKQRIRVLEKSKDNLLPAKFGYAWIFIMCGYLLCVDIYYL